MNEKHIQPAAADYDDLRVYLTQATPLEAPKGDRQWTCQHDFAKYVGLTESFKFCKKCDLKLPLE